MAKNVAIVLPIFSHFRLQLFLQLRDILARDDIHLELIYGKASDTVLYKQAEVDWASPKRNHEFDLFGKQLIWQALSANAYTADLAIIIQENRYLSNHLLLWRRHRAGLPTAFWGHGLNHQARPNSVGNLIKKSYVSKVDWWFAYTKGVAALIEGMGYPAERITVVQNAIDTRELMAARKHVKPEEAAALKDLMHVGEGPVGIYCGRLYDEKRIPFLLAACKQIRAQVPNFHMIVIGTGPDAPLVEKFEANHPWLHYVGACYDSDRARYFSLANIFMMPGLVGLAVLDAFALGTPMITTKYPYHSPEIEYLVNGENGIITPNTLEDYVAAVVAALKNPEKLEEMKRRCLEDAGIYTIEQMSQNIGQGIKLALEANLYKL